MVDNRYSGGGPRVLRPLSECLKRGHPFPPRSLDGICLGAFRAASLFVRLEIDGLDVPAVFAGLHMEPARDLMLFIHPALATVAYNESMAVYRHIVIVIGKHWLIADRAKGHRYPPTPLRQAALPLREYRGRYLHISQLHGNRFLR